MLISWISWLWPCHWPGSGIMRLAHHHMAASASARAACPPPWGRCSCWCTDTPWSPNMSPSSAHRQLSSEEGKIVKENVLDIFVFLTSPNCQTGHSQSHVTILKRPGDRDASHDQPQSQIQILCVSYISASFLSASNVTPIIAGKRPHFQKKRNHLNLSPSHPPPRSSAFTE